MKHFATVMLRFGIMLAALPTARAADTTCPQNPSTASAVYGNLIVPPGTQCELYDVTVTGNVQVQTNANLLTFVRVTIGGNVAVGTGALLFINFSPATINGNITADQCAGVEWAIFSLVALNQSPSSLVVMSAL